LSAGTRVSPAGRVLAVPVVAGGVLAGVWVAGGVITNDFGLAMALTFAWLVVAGLACVFVAWRWRALRAPVLGAYLVTAVALGIYLGRSTLLDDEVNERVATAAPPAGPAQQGRAAEEARNVLLSRGSFEPVAHAAGGTASVIRLAGGERVLTLTSFDVDNGPDLRVYLVAGPARDESEVTDFEDLGALKGNKGDQQYELPQGLDLDRYSTVVIWCRAFSVNFARAPLR
jgi:hypothetical protein